MSENADAVAVGGKGKMIWTGFRHPLYYEAEAPGGVTASTMAQTSPKGSTIHVRTSNTAPVMLPHASVEDASEAQASPSQAASTDSTPPSWASLFSEEHRRRSTATLASSATGESFESAPARLRRKFRTESSVTVTADGCIIQKGFDITPFASRGTSAASSPSSKASRPTPDAHEKMGTSRAARRITWDERSMNRFEDHDFAQSQEVKKVRRAVRSGSAPSCREVAPPQRADRERTNKPNTHRRVKSDQALANVPQRPDGPKRALSADVPRVEPRITIVPAEEAESAIATDDEEDQFETVEEQAYVQQRLPLRPSKRLLPPVRGILKKDRPSSASSQASELPAEAFLDTKTNERGSTKTVMPQRQTRFATQ